MKFTRNFQHLLIGVFYWSQYFDGRGHAADVVTSCPDYFVDGQINTIMCTVNITSISNAQCIPSPTAVTFQFTHTSGSVISLCSSSFPPTQCAPLAIAENCFCAQQTGDIISYQYNFMTEKGFQGGNVTCEICERSAMSLQRVNSPNCSSIQIVSTTTTTAASQERTTEGIEKHTADIIMSCPEYFVVGEVNTITCIVNMTSILNARCIIPPAKIDFVFVSFSGNHLRLCSSAYPGSHCVPQATAGTCFCGDQTRDIMTYQLNFVANKSDEGGTLQCDICALPMIPIVTESSPHCSIIKLASSSTIIPSPTSPTIVLPQTDGTLTCPAVWKDQDTVTLTCEVDSSRVNCAACPGLSGKISFNFISRGGSQVTACMITPYLDAECDGVFNAQGCRCREKTANDTYILEYTVTADVHAHVGGSWACVPVCLDSNYFTITKTIATAGNCTNVYFETTEVTKTTTTIEKVTTVTTTTTSTTVNATTTVTTLTATTTITTTVQAAP